MIVTINRRNLHNTQVLTKTKRLINQIKEKKNGNVDDFSEQLNYEQQENVLSELEISEQPEEIQSPTLNAVKELRNKKSRNR